MRVKDKQCLSAFAHYLCVYCWAHVLSIDLKFKFISIKRKWVKSEWSQRWDNLWSLISRVTANESRFGLRLTSNRSSNSSPFETPIIGKCMKRFSTKSRQKLFSSANIISFGNLCPQLSQLSLKRTLISDKSRYDFYRVLVKAIVPELNQALVSFIDFGYEESVAIDCLFVFTPMFVDCLPLAQRFVLSDIRPKDEEKGIQKSDWFEFEFSSV